jgi:hypothetical protein
MVKGFGSMITIAYLCSTDSEGSPHGEQKLKFHHY